MADSKISQLTPITGADLADGDELVVARGATLQNFSVTRAELFSSTPPLSTDSLTAATADINGGTIDGAVIGGNTPAAVTGTTGTFSGDLTVDTDTLFVDAANNRVGVGTSSPAYPLHVSTSSYPAVGVYRALDVGVVGSAAQKIELGAFSGSTPTPSATIESVLDSSATTGTLSFSTRSGGALGERMHIDSAGRVTTPSQPFFLGQPSVDYSGGGAPAGVMGITAIHNNGGHFNATNSRFTAPVAGWYLTTWGGLQLSPAVTSLMINGTRTHNGNHWSGSGPAYITMTQTSIQYLNTGDYLNIEQWNGGGYFSTWYLWSVTLLG